MSATATLVRGHEIIKSVLTSEQEEEQAAIDRIVRAAPTLDEARRQRLTALLGGVRR